MDVDDVPSLGTLASSASIFAQDDPQASRRRHRVYHIHIKQSAAGYPGLPPRPCSATYSTCRRRGAQRSSKGPCLAQRRTPVQVHCLALEDSSVQQRHEFLHIHPCQFLCAPALKSPDSRHSCHTQSPQVSLAWPDTYTRHKSQHARAKDSTKRHIAPAKTSSKDDRGKKWPRGDSKITGEGADGQHTRLAAPNKKRTRNGLRGTGKEMVTDSPFSHAETGLSS
jgi:hypothetical protein